MNRSVSAQPYGSSSFLPGKLAGKAATFLLNTGCTTNLLSRRLFDTLNARDRASYLKDRLVEAPILAYLDPAKEYILDTDASDHNVGLCCLRFKTAVRWW